MQQSHFQRPVHHIGGQCQLLSRWCMCMARVAASHESIFLKDSGASIFIISSYIHPDLLRLYVLQYYLIEIKTRISVGGHVSCLSSHHLTPLTVKLLPCASGNLPRRTVMPRGDSFLQVFDLNKIKATLDNSKHIFRVGTNPEA